MSLTGSDGCKADPFQPSVGSLMGAACSGAPCHAMKTLLCPHCSLRQGAQGASLLAPGKSGLHVLDEGERVLALESREGTSQLCALAR